MMATDLEELIEQYLALKNKSLNTLSQASGVSYSTVRRVAQGEAEPNLENTLQLLTKLTDNEGMATYLRKHYPVLGNHLAEIQKGLAIKNGEVMQQALRDKTRYTIQLLASRAFGLTKGEVLDLLGQRAVSKLSELAAGGVLREELIEGAHVYFAEEDYSFVEIPDILREHQLCQEYIREEYRGKGKQFVTMITEGVTEEAQQKIHVEIDGCLGRITAIARSNKGNVPVFAGVIMGQVN